MGLAARAGMEGESRELSDAGVVRWRFGADGAKRQGLAPGVGAGGDAVVEGGTEELLETVGGFEVEGGGAASRCWGSRITGGAPGRGDGWSSERRPRTDSAEC